MAKSTEQSEQLLRECLQKTDFFTGPIDGKKAWVCFKELGNQAFVCLEDLLLWETGIYSHRDERYFFCAMVRQFSHAQHMEQLHLEIHFEPNDVLAKLKGELWSEDYKSLPEFYQAVESSESFTLPFTQYPALAYRLYIEQL